MNRLEHLKLDKIIFYKEFNNVHQWLDEDLEIHKDNWYRHWIDRHHIEAIKDKYGWFTVEYNAAYVHILYDWLSHFSMALVPKDKKEVEDTLQILQVI